MTTMKAPACTVIDCGHARTVPAGETREQQTDNGIRWVGLGGIAVCHCHGVGERPEKIPEQYADLPLDALPAEPFPCDESRSGGIRG